MALLCLMLSRRIPADESEPCSGSTPAALAEPTVAPPSRWVALLARGQRRAVGRVLRARSRCCSPSRPRRIDAGEQGAGPRAGHRARRADLGDLQPGGRRLLRPDDAARRAAGCPGSSAARWAARPPSAFLSARRTSPVMVLGWCGVQASLNAMLAAVTAMIPDQVPVDRRGRIGGIVAVAQTIGVVGRHRHRGGDRQHRRRLPGDRGVPAGARGPVLAVVASDLALPAEAPAAVRRAPLPRVVLDLAAAPPRLRAGPG